MQDTHDTPGADRAGIARSLVDWTQRAHQLSLDGRPFIDGRRDGAAWAARFACISPQDGKPVTEMPRGGRAEIDSAVAAARTHA